MSKNKNRPEIPDEKIKLGKYAERSRKNGFGKFCLILQAIMSAAFMGVLVLLDMLPLKYLALAALILSFCGALHLRHRQLERKKE